MLNFTNFKPIFQANIFQFKANNAILLSMKKLITISLLSLFLATPFFTFAATSAGLTPSSPFYFFDTLSEKIVLFFTFNPEKKAEKALEYANERLSEAEASTEDKNSKAVETALAGYKESLSLASEKSKEVKDSATAENLFNEIADNASTSEKVLVAVFNKVPEEAREVITRAIEASKNSQAEAHKQISELKKSLSGQITEIEALRKEVDILKKNQQRTNVTEKIVEVRPSVPLRNIRKLESEEIYAKIASTVVHIQTGDGSGTGIIIESNGTIITNAHVVSGADRVTVKVGGLVYVASVLGRDESVDLALLKLDGNNLSFAELGDSSDAALKRGEELFAFGFPLDFSGDVTATKGILSARQLVDGVTYLQTDASIHPGNSGGPLVNNKGQVIGINSLVLSARGKGGNIGGTGIGFAIPVNVARGLIPDLKAGRNIVVPKIVEPAPLSTPQPFTLPLPPPQPAPLPLPPVFTPPSPPPPPPQPTPFEFNPNMRVVTEADEMGRPFIALYISISESFDKCILSIIDLNYTGIYSNNNYFINPGYSWKPNYWVGSPGVEKRYTGVVPGHTYEWEFTCEKQGFNPSTKKGSFAAPNLTS